MALRVGINPLTWSNDDQPELGAENSLETCLGEAREAGYAGIELGGKFPRTAAELRPLLARHRLRLISGWYGSRLLERAPEAEIAALRAHLDLLSDMGCAVVVFAEVSGCVHGDASIPLSRRRRLGADDWAGFGKRLTTVAEHIADRGLAMAYHHHMGTVVETGAEIDRLMTVTGDAVGLLLDTGHLTYAGGDPARLVGRHGARINHVHCKDVRRPVLARALAGDWSFLDAVVAGAFTVPGDGCIDFPGVLAALRDAGYGGWLVVEADQDPAKAHPATYARMGREGLARAAARIE